MMLIWLPKAVPKWAALGLLPVCLIVSLAVFKMVTSLLPVNAPLAYLTIVSGEVKVSDGITDLNARDGALVAGKMRTLVKTGKGIASLRMMDGASVILDSASTIEFNRQNLDSSGGNFAFNLVKGRAIVIKENDSRTATHLLIGGDVAVRVFQAMIGLEIIQDGGIVKRIDCLAGQCLVNGLTLLTPGQNAQFMQDSTMKVTVGIPFDVWVPLMRASQPSPTMLNLFVSLLPTSTPTASSTATTGGANQAFPLTGNDLITPSPSATQTLLPTATPTPTRTIIPSPSNSPTAVVIVKRRPSSTATPTPSLPPESAETATPTKTRLPSATPYPTYTSPPEQTKTNTPLPTDTDTPMPTSSPTETTTPTLTLTPTSTETSLPTDTPVPTETPTPTETLPSTDVIFSTDEIAFQARTLAPPHPD
ncbi:MAG: hypothetical protein PHQ40_12280 [Anaerolineaceae bacterium]|nr:hypothetical protein [Anaerolineaceae bacterium]